MRYFFRSAKSFLGLLFVSAFFVPLVSFAESPSPSGSLQIVDCFDYYHFQSVQFGIGTDRGVYAPGDVVTFSGSVTNQNIHPIVDGYVFTRISRERTDYQTMGHDIVDEVFIAEDVALAPLGSSDVSFSWNVPENLPSGDYRADYFFSVGKKFNLSGLPFTNEIVGGSAFFSVENVSDENGSGAFVSFDRGATTVNSQKYAHIGDWVRVEDGASAVVSNTLVNESGASQTVDVVTSVYYWDSLFEGDEISSDSQQFVLATDVRQPVSIQIPSVNQNVYAVKMVASVSGEIASIVNVRVVRDGEQSRINYPAIANFPFISGESVGVFSCLHNTSFVSTDGSMDLTLTDRGGAEIYSTSYDGPITGGMMGLFSEFVPEKNYEYVALSAVVKDKEGKVADHYSVVYDCASSPSLCPKKSVIADIMTDSSNPWRYVVFGAALLVAVIAVLVIVRMVRLGGNRSTSGAASFLFLFVAVSVLFGFAGVGSVSAAFYGEKSITSTANVTINGKSPSQTYFYQGARKVDVSLSNVFTIGMTQGNTTVQLCEGEEPEKIEFDSRQEVSFFVTGGAYDSPYAVFCSAGNYDQFLAQCSPTVINIETFETIGAGAAASRILPTRVGVSTTKSSYTLISSDPSVLECIGTVCIPKKVGTATVTVSVAQTPSVVHALFDRALYGAGRVDDTSQPETKSVPTTFFSGGGTLSSFWNNIANRYGLPSSNPGASAGWNIMVTDDECACPPGEAYGPDGRCIPCEDVDRDGRCDPCPPGEARNENNVCIPCQDVDRDGRCDPCSPGQVYDSSGKCVPGCTGDDCYIICKDGCGADVPKSMFWRPEDVSLSGGSLVSLCRTTNDDCSTGTPVTVQDSSYSNDVLDVIRPDSTSSMSVGGREATAGLKVVRVVPELPNRPMKDCSNVSSLDCYGGSKPRGGTAVLTLRSQADPSKFAQHTFNVKKRPSEPECANNYNCSGACPQIAQVCKIKSSADPSCIDYSTPLNCSGSSTGSDFIER